MQIWYSLLEALGAVLRLFHDATVGLFGDYSWFVAIVLLTLVVRLAMLPLAVRQFRSMQAMQKLRPQMKKIQQKYKTDRGMMRTDPEKFREKRQKQQEELMALYKEQNVNPASSCLPLIAQMPIFIALFSVLRSPDVIPELVDAHFPFDATLQMRAGEAGIIAIGLLILMGVTTFVQQKQMMGRQAVAADDQQLQQQKMLMYIMPVFLVFLGYSLPVGVLVYWVTTNLVQMAQQWYMLREVDELAGAGAAAASGGGKGAPSDGGKGAPSEGSSRKTGSDDKRPSRKRTSDKGKGNAGRNGVQGNGHRPGGPKRLGRNRDETRDKRR